MTWEETISAWQIPGTLIQSWEYNRKRLLEFCEGQYPGAASLELLNALLGDPTLQRRLLWNEIPKPASLSSFRSQRPAQPERQRTTVDVFTGPIIPETPEQKRARERAESSARYEQDRKQREQEKRDRQAAIEAREDRQRRAQELAAINNSFRPFR